MDDTEKMMRTLARRLIRRNRSKPIRRIVRLLIDEEGIPSCIVSHEVARFMLQEITDEVNGVVETDRPTRRKTVKA